jgi:hypothetical protein
MMNSEGLVLTLTFRDQTQAYYLQNGIRTYIPWFVVDSEHGFGVDSMPRGCEYSEVHAMARYD